MEFAKDLLEFFRQSDDMDIDPPQQRRPRFKPTTGHSRHRKSRGRIDSFSSNEDSTFCQKNRDFYFSNVAEEDLVYLLPKMSYSHSDFCMKNSDYYFSGPVIYEETERFIEKAQEIAEGFNGRCLSSQCSDPTELLSYECIQGHVWQSSDVLLSMKWCQQCESALKRAEKYAEGKGGKCLGFVGKDTIEFECENKHRWTSNGYVWCDICKRNMRNWKKEEILRRLKEEEEEDARIQQMMFREARNKMVRYDDNAEGKAKEKALEECRDDMAQFESVYLVHLILEGSEDYLKDKFFKKNEQSEFRKLAVCVHPDKNKHELASQAFQKLLKLVS